MSLYQFATISVKARFFFYIHGNRPEASQTYPKTFHLTDFIVCIFSFGVRGERREGLISVDLSDKGYIDQSAFKVGRTQSKVFHICSYKQMHTSLPHSLQSLGI